MIEQQQVDKAFTEWLQSLQRPTIAEFEHPYSNIVSSISNTRRAFEAGYQRGRENLFDEIDHWRKRATFAEQFIPKTDQDD